MKFKNVVLGFISFLVIAFLFQNCGKMSSLKLEQQLTFSSKFGAMCEVQLDPGHVPAHRLNKDEYNVTVQQLLGITTNPGENLVDENVAYGFNNNANILSMTPLSTERFLDAAEAAVAEALTSNRNGIFLCNPAQLNRQCVDDSLAKLAEEAFRKPLSAFESARITAKVDAALAEGLSLEEGFRWGAEWILMSPSFLFRQVSHPDPNNGNSVIQLSGYEMASRLSFFLWGQGPDEQLLARAADNSLQNKSVIEAEVDRMLRDPKAGALIDNFAYQWLELHEFEAHTTNQDFYPLSDALKGDMMTETKMLLEDVFLGDHSVMKLLNSETSYLNQRLASHYGVSGASSTQNFVEVNLSETERRGLLGHASILTLTSLSDRTSVVIRGKWILDNFLCESPAPPPPGVPDGLPGDPGGSLKDKMAAHSTNPVCASCHKTIDPLGFALESFDGFGMARTAYRNGADIDTTGEMPDGAPISDALDLNNILQDDPRYRKCITKKLMTYALGRGLGTKDQCTVNRIAADYTGEEAPFSSMIKAIVTSDPFTKQSGDGGN